MGLEQYGWAPFFAREFKTEQKKLQQKGAEILVPGRVAWAAREKYRLVTDREEVEAVPLGRLRSRELPVVGDWVVVDGEHGVIHAVLPRRTRIARAASGDRTQEQVVAANVDVVLVVMGLDEDFNLRRLERLVAMAGQSRAAPVIILTKTDLCSDVAARVEDTRRTAPELPVLAVSSPRDEGVEAVQMMIQPGQTAVLVGSSGAGKSTLLNRLAGENLARTREVRERDGRGTHTTSHRELFLLPFGGLVVDNPGIREVQLWATGEDPLPEAFPEIHELAPGCRFRDCSHKSEPGCAVLEAVRQGELDGSRLQNYHKLENEAQALRIRQDEAARRQKEKEFGKLIKSVMSERRKHRG